MKDYYKNLATDRECSAKDIILIKIIMKIHQKYLFLASQTSFYKECRPYTIEYYL